MNNNIINSGKSRQVIIGTNCATKIGLNTDCKNLDDLKNNLILGLDGEFENLKEILVWQIISSDKFLSKSFARILDFSLQEDTIVFAEKLTKIDEKDFYTKFYTKFIYLNEWTNLVYSYLDNHTLDNYENFGFDEFGNLKLLDYAIRSDVLLEKYGFNLGDLSFESYENLKTKIKKDIEVGNFEKFRGIYLNLSLLAIVLQNYDNYPKFLWHLHKNKIKTKTEIFNKIKKEIKRYFTR